MSPDSTSLSPLDAQALLSEVSDLRRDTRADLQSCTWMWFLLWSAIAGGAAASVLWEEVAGWYWLGAVPIGLIGTALIDLRWTREAGVRRHDWPYWAIGGAITVLNTVASGFLSPEVVVVWVWVVLGLGFAGFCLLERAPEAAGVLLGYAIVAVAAGVVVSDTFALYPLLALAFALTLAGIAWRLRT